MGSGELVYEIVRASCHYHFHFNFAAQDGCGANECAYAQRHRALQMHAPLVSMCRVNCKYFQIPVHATTPQRHDKSSPRNELRTISNTTTGSLVRPIHPTNLRGREGPGLRK